MITKQTALDIAMSYREVETAEKLLAEIGDGSDKRAEILRLHVTLENSTRHVFYLQWSLAKPIIEAHIANHKARIAALSEKERDGVAE